MRLAGILPGHAPAAALIGLGGDALKVPGIDAVTYPTEVIDLASGRDGTPECSVEPAMRKRGPALPACVEHAVTARITGARPEPADGAIEIDVPEKPDHRIDGMWRHGIPLPSA